MQSIATKYAALLMHRESLRDMTKCKCGKQHLVVIEVLIAKVAGQLIAQLHDLTKLGGDMRPYSAHALQSQIAVEAFRSI